MRVALDTGTLKALYDPAAGARELCRVIRPGGRIGIVPWPLLVFVVEKPAR